MPRVPSYQPGQVGPVEVTGARFRAADNNGGVAGGFADGLAGLGKATMQYARTQDAINAQNDDTQARKMAAEAGLKINALTQQYRGLMGSNAREQQEATLKQIEGLRDEYLGQAGNGRMRMMLEERLTGLYSSSSAAIGEHAFKESQAERAGAFKGEQLMYSELAATAEDPMQRLGAINAGIKSIEAEMDFRGVDDPNVRGLAVKQYTSGVHRDVIDKMLSAVDPDVEMVSAYFDANRDEMLGDDRLKVMTDLQKPLQRRAAADIFSLAVSGMKPIEGAGQLSGAPFNPEDALKFIVKDLEGGSKTSVDTGGLTKYGISTKGNPGVDVANLTEGKAMDIYRRKYLADLPLKGLSSEASLIALDASVNHGPEFAKRLIREAGNDPAKMLSMRRTEYARLVREDPGKYGKYEKGWENRLKAIEGRIGSDAATPSAWDKDQVYANIERVGRERGASPELIEQAKAVADKRIGEREELLVRQEREASDAAFKSIVELGDGFTSINQLPRSVRDQLSPQDEFKYREMAEKNLAGDGIPKQGAEATRLEILKRRDPEAFAKENLQAAMGKVNPEELRSLVLDQAALMGKPTKPDVVRAGIVKAVNWGERMGGVKVEDKDFPAVYDTMDTLLREKAKKGALTDQDYDAAFKSAVTASVKTSGGGLFGMGSNTRAPYEITYDKLSDKQKGEAYNLLVRQGVKSPTKGQVLSVARSLMVQN
jgi:lysozyme family protein